MPLSFTKMHGLGNDYLYVRAQALPDDPAGLSRRLSDRHRGVGSDGMIWLLPSAVADCRMRIFNADGSEAAMCGNGIRCVGKYLYDKGIVPRTILTVETNAGIKTLQLCVADGQVRTVTVAMGRAAVGQPITVAAAGRQLTLRPVDMGNPHAVCFVPAAENAPVAEAGAVLQHTAAFPDGVNAEFVQQIDPHTLRMRVYERGSGITMACGTGACAAAVAAVAEGHCPAGTPLCVRLDGGDLTVTVAADGGVTMTGPAETICEGTVEL